MSRLPALMSGLARASRGVSTFGAGLEALALRLTQLETATPERFATTDGWQALLGDLAVPEDSLRFADASAPDDTGPTDRSGINARAGAGPLRVTPAAAVRTVIPQDPGASAAAAMTASGRDVGSAMESPTRDSHNQKAVGAAPKPPRPSLPCTDPMAKIGASQIISTTAPQVTGSEQRPPPSSGDPDRSRVHTHTDSTNARLQTVLDRIAAQATAGHPAPPATRPQANHTGPGPMPGPIRGAPSVSAGTAIDPATDAKSAMASARRGPAPALPRSSGLARLVTRAEALDLPSASGPNQPTVHTGPSTSIRMGIGPTATPPHTGPGIPHRAPASWAEPSATPVPDTHSTEQTQLARDLAEVLRRQARAAGIDLDGGLE